MMNTRNKVEAFYSREQPFREELNILRGLALETGAVEDFKWSGPVYTTNGKNVFGIMGFKHHFGLWFFNGVFMKDPLGVLQAAQKGTKALRHWKFYSQAEIDKKSILAYLREAIQNQQQGLEHKPEPKQEIKIPRILQERLSKEKDLLASFDALSPYKQREYCEHITTAKQEKTRLSRLEKMLPLIRKGLSLNDKYRNPSA